jgi:hypothetical protein
VFPLFLLTERSNADEEQKIDKSGSKEVLSSKRPLWKRDLAAAWAIMDCNSVARWRFSRQIWKILADLKVIWQAKNISGGLPISGGFDQFCLGLFLSGGFWRFWSLC